MAIKLGQNQYGTAENRVVRVYRDTPRHQIRDLNVSSALRDDFSDAHITSDQGVVLPTDTQKNTAFSFAKEKGIHAIEEFGLTLADHFISRAPTATGARVEIEEYAWHRIEVDGSGHDHSFVKSGQGVRTTVVNVDGVGPDRKAHVVSGVRDLTLLKTTGSEFHGFFEDKYTTLQPTNDRTAVTAPSPPPSRPAAVGCSHRELTPAGRYGSGRDGRRTIGRRRMKLLRVGARDAERPVALDDQGALRDLSSLTADVDGRLLGDPAALSANCSAT